MPILTEEPYHLDVLDMVTTGICTFLDPRFKQHAITSPTAIEKVKGTVTKLLTHLESDLAPVESSKKKAEKLEPSVLGLFDKKQMVKLQQANATSALMEMQRDLVIGRPVSRLLELPTSEDSGHSRPVEELEGFRSFETLKIQYPKLLFSGSSCRLELLGAHY
ncbi:hypothetical protein J6590_073196 [Homalodisca vitripennis]|nr:hypothetical protein J6590_073196 [Homalodisca vitripennis]